MRATKQRSCRFSMRAATAVLLGLAISLPSSAAQASTGNLLSLRSAESSDANIGPAYVSLELDVRQLDEGDREAISAMLDRRASELFAQRKVQPARGEEDLVIRAIVSKESKEDGTIAFLVSFFGRHRGALVVWPEPKMRCEYCTDGEFGDRFAEAMLGLLEHWEKLRQEEAELARRATEQADTAKGEEPQQLSRPANASAARDAVQPVDVASPPPRGLQKPGGLGWAGIGVAALGVGGVVAGILMIDRDVPIDGELNRVKKFQATPGTYAGVSAGAAALLVGTVLFIVDQKNQRMRRARVQ